MLQSDSRRDTTERHHQFSANIIEGTIQVSKCGRNGNSEKI